MVIIVSRVVLAVLGLLGAYQVGAALPLERWFSSPWYYAAWAAVTVVGGLAGLLLGGLFGRLLRDRMRAIDRAADRRSAAELMVGALGLVVGLVAAALAGVAVAQLPIIGPYLLLPVVLVVAYVFSRVAARKHVDILRLVGIRSRGRGRTPRHAPHRHQRDHRRAPRRRHQDRASCRARSSCPTSCSRSCSGWPTRPTASSVRAGGGGSRSSRS